MVTVPHPLVRFGKCRRSCLFVVAGHLGNRLTGFKGLSSFGLRFVLRGLVHVLFVGRE